MPAHPIDDLPVSGFFRKAARKPARAAHSRSHVVELRAERVRCERDEGNGDKVEVAPVRKESPCKQKRFAFDNHTGEQQQVPVFEEKKLQGCDYTPTTLKLLSFTLFALLMESKSTVTCSIWPATSSGPALMGRMARSRETYSKSHPELSHTTQYRCFHRNKSLSGARNRAAMLLLVSSHGKPRIKAAGVREVLPMTRPAAAANASAAARNVA